MNNLKLHFLTSLSLNLVGRITISLEYPPRVFKSLHFSFVEFIVTPSHRFVNIFSDIFNILFNYFDIRFSYTLLAVKRRMLYAPAQTSTHL